MKPVVLLRRMHTIVILACVFLAVAFAETANWGGNWGGHHDDDLMYCRQPKSGVLRLNLSREPCEGGWVEYQFPCVSDLRLDFLRVIVLRRCVAPC
jgi:hypothetical protein